MTRLVVGLCVVSTGKAGVNSVEELWRRLFLDNLFILHNSLNAYHHARSQLPAHLFVYDTNPTCPQLALERPRGVLWDQTTS
jgi:hypothetical protein